MNLNHLCASSASGVTLLQKLGSYLGGILSQSPSPGPLSEAVLPQGCPPSSDSFLFIFSPFFGHNVSRWNSYSSLPVPIRKLGWRFLVFLLHFWEMSLGGVFGRAPAHHGQGWGSHPLWDPPCWQGMPDPHDTKHSLSWGPLSSQLWGCWLTCDSQNELVVSVRTVLTRVTMPRSSQQAVSGSGCLADGRRNPHKKHNPSRHVRPLTVSTWLIIPNSNRFTAPGVAGRCCYWEMLFHLSQKSELDWFCHLNQ